MKQETSNIPLRKYTSIHEASTVICNLLSDFSDQITGQNILCEGGFIKSF